MTGGVRQPSGAGSCLSVFRGFSRGFTLVEVLVSLVLAALLLMGVQKLYSSLVRSSAHGVDRLDAIAAAARLWRSLHQDLLRSQAVTVGAGQEAVAPGEIGVFRPGEVDAGSVAESVCFHGEAATVTYSLRRQGERLRVIREAVIDGVTESPLEFGGDRIKMFRVFPFFRDQRVHPQAAPCRQEFLHISLVVGSDDPTVPAATFPLSVVLPTSSRSSVRWQPVDLPFVPPSR